MCAHPSFPTSLQSGFGLPWQRLPFHMPQSGRSCISRESDREKMREREREGVVGGGNTELCLTRPLIARRHTPDRHCLPWLHTNTRTSLPARAQTALPLYARLFCKPLSLCLSNSVLSWRFTCPPPPPLLDRSCRHRMCAGDSYLRLSTSR